MENNYLRFAFALSNTGNFEAKHFGEADKYFIYEWNNDAFILIKEEVNLFKNFEEEQSHGLMEKGKAIINLLGNFEVKVLVSKQFGKNIHMVNHHFIPVIVYSETTHEVLNVLQKHLRWIKDELINNPGNFRLFTIKNGIMKSSIPADNT
ncbi:MAG: hypothetical protein JW723_12370 [Bacteroidales bacterium]|nr:hypothetical protein [Bacteroidales bacterium]